MKKKCKQWPKSLRVRENLERGFLGRRTRGKYQPTMESLSPAVEQKGESGERVTNRNK